MPLLHTDGNLFRLAAKMCGLPHPTTEGSHWKKSPRLWPLAGNPVDKPWIASDARPVAAPRFGIAVRRASSKNAQMQQIPSAAVTAPDHGRLRPWRSIGFEGNGREQLGDLMAEQVRADKPEAEGKNPDKIRGKALRAPTVIALACKPTIGHKAPVIEKQTAVAAAGVHLKGGYWPDNGRWACKAGYGFMVDRPPPVLQFLPRGS